MRFVLQSKSRPAWRDQNQTKKKVRFPWAENGWSCWTRKIVSNSFQSQVEKLYFQLVNKSCQKDLQLQISGVALKPSFVIFCSNKKDVNQCIQSASLLNLRRAAWNGESCYKQKFARLEKKPAQSTRHPPPGMLVTTFGPSCYVVIYCIQECPKEKLWMLNRLSRSVVTETMESLPTEMFCCSSVWIAFSLWMAEVVHPFVLIVRMVSSFLLLILLSCNMERAVLFVWIKSKGMLCNWQGEGWLKN